MSEALASILINNYNYGRFLSEAIDSALGQTWPSVEVVVVDDGSTDDSREIIARYGDRVIPVLKENGGQGSTFNAGFAASRGRYVLFLDSDDTFELDKTARVVRVFQQNPQAGWVFHPLRLRDARNGKVVKNRMPEQGEAGAIDFRAAIWRGEQPRFAPATSGLCFTRKLLSRVLPMPVDGGTSADRFLKPMALHGAAGYYLNEVLAEQKIHGANAHTLSPRRARVAAKSMVLVAGWMRERDPKLRRLCNKLMAQGLGTYDASGGVDPNYAGAVEKYLGNSGLLDRLSIAARRFYHGRVKRASEEASAASPLPPTQTTT